MENFDIVAKKNTAVISAIIMDYVCDIMNLSSICQGGTTSTLTLEQFFSLFII